MFRKFLLLSLAASSSVVGVSLQLAIPNGTTWHQEVVGQVRLNPAGGNLSNAFTVGSTQSNYDMALDHVDGSGNSVISAALTSFQLTSGGSLTPAASLDSSTGSFDHNNAQTALFLMLNTPLEITLSPAADPVSIDILQSATEATLLSNNLSQEQVDKILVHLQQRLKGLTFCLTCPLPVGNINVSDTWTTTTTVPTIALIGEQDVDIDYTFASYSSGICHITGTGTLDLGVPNTCTLAFDVDETTGLAQSTSLDIAVSLLGSDGVDVGSGPVDCEIVISLVSTHTP